MTTAIQTPSPEQAIDFGAVVTLALQAGSVHWVSVADSSDKGRHKPDYGTVISSPGGSLTLATKEGPKTVNRISLLVAACVIRGEHPNIYDRLIQGDWTAEDADTVLQYATFGRLELPYPDYLRRK